MFGQFAANVSQSRFHFANIYLKKENYSSIYLHNKIATKQNMKVDSRVNTFNG